MLIYSVVVPFRDREGKAYPRKVFDDVEINLCGMFGGFSRAVQSGGWTDPDGVRENDTSYRYDVAVTDSGDVAMLDGFFRAFNAERLHQTCLYRHVEYADVAFLE